MIRKKVKIEYPCQWSYRIIGKDEQLLRKAAASAAGSKEYRLSVSNRSSGGKYQSLVLDIIVNDEAERLRIFRILRDNDSIKYII